MNFSVLLCVCIYGHQRSSCAKKHVLIEYDQIRFPASWLSTLSVITLCLKDPQMEDNTIYPELLTAGAVG